MQQSNTSSLVIRKAFSAHELTVVFPNRTMEQLRELMNTMSNTALVVPEFRLTIVFQGDGRKKRVFYDGVVKMWQYMRQVLQTPGTPDKLPTEEELTEMVIAASIEK